MKIIKLVIIVGILAFRSCCVSASPIIYGYEFDWTPTGADPRDQGIIYSLYNASFLYSSGITANGIFTPTGLTSYSLGGPFGSIGPGTGTSLAFLTDTPYGPSFQVQGTIEPIINQNNVFNPGYQEFSGSIDLAFLGQTESITYFQNGNTFGGNISGIWTETIVTSPEGGSSVVLLAVALASLAFFHAAHRAHTRARS